MWEDEPGDRRERGRVKRWCVDACNICAFRDRRNKSLYGVIPYRKAEDVWRWYFLGAKRTYTAVAFLPFRLELANQGLDTAAPVHERTNDGAGLWMEENVTGYRVVLRESQTSRYWSTWDRTTLFNDLPPSEPDLGRLPGDALTLEGLVC